MKHSIECKKHTSQCLCNTCEHDSDGNAPFSDTCCQRHIQTENSITTAITCCINYCPDYIKESATEKFKPIPFTDILKGAAHIE